MKVRKINKHCPGGKRVKELKEKPNEGNKRLSVTKG